jgi:ABC-2 type transport system permease protein
VISASLRSLIPAALLIVVGLALGAQWPGIGGLAIAILVVMGMGTVAALWGCALALKFKSQSAAPLMQAGMFVLILTTTSYAPLALLTGWLHTVAKYNPATQIIETARQGFVGGVSWGDTWPGLLALAALLAVLTALALRGMRRTAV